MVAARSASFLAGSTRKATALLLLGPAHCLQITAGQQDFLHTSYSFRQETEGQHAIVSASQKVVVFPS